MMAYVNVPFGTSKEQAKPEADRLIKMARKKLKNDSLYYPNYDYLAFESVQKDPMAFLAFAFASISTSQVAVFGKNFDKDSTGTILFIACSVLKKQVVVEE